MLSEEGGQVVLAIASGHYRFVSAERIEPATVDLQTSEPLDHSTNPEEIDMSGAWELVRWDFAKESDASRWTAANNAKIERRDGKVFLVATGPDPQLTTTLDKPLSGSLVIELRARPTKGATPQFFWASPSSGFNARQQTQRPLNPNRELTSYLFRIGDEQPLKQLRFDPMSDEGELEIESLVIYQLP